MGKLKVLPAHIANMIAAGEVVQRPASVVKELVENAVDAGATQITVGVTDSGRTMIMVTDNGCGMSPSDAILCFERHATSKIASAEDLSGIVTYGFRGEALASIAAVAEVTLKTRRQQDETGTEIHICGSSEVTSSSVASPVGSTFSVRNLFFNTPARRKFLKSDAVELKHIVEEFTRIALVRPDISFTLLSNGRELFVLKKAKSLKFRILDLLGSNVVGDVLDIEARTTLVRVSGFIGRPDAARKTAGNQFFFVNGRFFHSSYLHKAVMKAYEDLVPEGLTPSYFIFLELDPSSVDVNIHPTKYEVKFEDDSLIFQVLYACVKEALGKTVFAASIDFDTEGSVQMPQLGAGFEQYRGDSISPAVDFDSDYNPFEPASQAPAAPDFSSYVDKRENYGKLFEQNAAVSARNLIIQGKYIITPSASGVMLVNIRRAWERILYERALNALSSSAHVTQTALFPVQVRVGVEQRLLFEDNASLLSSLGFDIAPFGNDTVVVNGVPEGYSCEPGKIQQLVSDLQLILSDEGTSLPEVMHCSMAAKFATLGSLNVEKMSSPNEAQRLIDALFGCENAELTPSGKKIVALVGIDEIDKKF